MAENNSFFRRVVAKSIAHGGIRSFVIFLAVMLGSAVCAAFVNIYADIDRKVGSELNGYGANLVVSPENLENAHLSEADIEKKLSSISNLKSSAFYLFGSANIGVTNAVVMGVNFSNLKALMPFLDLKSGEFVGVDFDDKNALIGEDLAKLTGAKVGDVLEISGVKSGKIHKVRVKGIVYDGQKEDGLLIISLELAQEIFGKEGQISYAEAIVSGDYAALSEISARLSGEGARFEPVSKISKAQGQILEKIKLLMALVGLTVLFIASVCINATLSSILLSRVKEFALLRAIGASGQNVLRLVISEIFAICLAGSLAGAFVGYLLAILLGHLIFSSGVDFRLVSFGAALVLSLAFAALASYYPIKKSLNPNLANLLKE